MTGKWAAGKGNNAIKPPLSAQLGRYEKRRAMREIGPQRYKYWLSTWWAVCDVDIVLVSKDSVIPLLHPT